MSSTTVAEFASELKKSTETLLEQLKSAGLAKNAASDVLTDADKHKFLNHLQAAHGTAGAERKKITLVKKQTTEIKQADASGKARTIQVEVRKKRTFVRRDDGSDAVPESAEVFEASAPAAPVIDQAELARREEEARHQAEFLRRQEEELAARRQAREEQEAKARAAHEAAAQAQASTQADAADGTASDSAAKPRKLTKAAEKAALDVAAQAEAVAATQAAEQAQREQDAAKAAAASREAALEENKRAADLGDRRRKAEAEAAAIRVMMSARQGAATTQKSRSQAGSRSQSGDQRHAAQTSSRLYSGQTS